MKVHIYRKLFLTAAIIMWVSSVAIFYIYPTPIGIACVVIQTGCLGINVRSYQRMKRWDRLHTTIEDRFKHIFQEE